MFVVCCVFVCFKQRTAYEMRISDWSSDVCSSDLLYGRGGPDGPSNLRRLFGPYRCPRELRPSHQSQAGRPACRCAAFVRGHHHVVSAPSLARRTRQESGDRGDRRPGPYGAQACPPAWSACRGVNQAPGTGGRTEERRVRKECCNTWT